MNVRSFLLAAALATATLTSSLQAQTNDAYPNRALRLIVPNVPGGATDFIARLVQPHWSEQLGQQVVIDNRGGGAGNIGLETAARAAPDGHTLMIGSNTQAINPSIYPKFPVKPLQDLIPVTRRAALAVPSRARPSGQSSRDPTALEPASQ